MDPMAVREKNWIKHEEFPFTTVAGLTYDSGNYEAATDKAKELFGYDALRTEQRERRERGDTVQLGIGISTFTEMCGLAPSRVLGSLSLRRGRLGARGDPHAAHRQGRGRHRVPRRTARDTRRRGARSSPTSSGVPFEDVEVLHGDTQSSHKGMDTYGSRSLTVGAMAVVAAADKVKAKAAQDRRAHAGGRRGRRRVRRRRVPGPRRGHRGQVGVHPGRRARRVRRARPAGRRRAEPGLRGHVRPGELLVPARHPPVRDRGGHRDRPGADPVVRLRRRHRQGGQPADRRGPGARRARAGHRAGAVRGGRARRVRHAHHRHARRLPRAVGGGPAVVHDRPHRDAVDVERVGRQGSRRGRHDRVHPGRGQRDRGRGAALGVNDIQMPCTPMRVWQAIQTGQTDAGGLGSEAGGGLGSIDTSGGAQ